MSPLPISLVLCAPLTLTSTSLLVLAQLYGMLHLCELRDVFTTLELATLLTAAVCHDLDHPGFNNKSVYIVHACITLPHALCACHSVYMCACVRACVCACMCTCVLACVHA